MRANNTALYLRLSRDDGEGGESESIHNQREFLLKYVRENNLIGRNILNKYSVYTQEETTVKN